MPKAADSNNTNISGIHPAILLERQLENLLYTLQAYRDIITSLAEPGRNSKTLSDNTGILLNCIIKQFDQKNDQIKVLVKQFIVCTSGQADRPHLKTLRNRFITELMERGFSNREISQGMQLNLSFINKLSEKFSAQSNAVDVLNPVYTSQNTL